MEFFRIRRDIPFMRHALVFNVISLLTFLAAVFFLATRGLHFSIEFTGGTVIETAVRAAGRHREGPRDGRGARLRRRPGAEFRHLARRPDPRAGARRHQAGRLVARVFGELCKAEGGTRRQPRTSPASRASRRRARSARRRRRAPSRCGCRAASSSARRSARSWPRTAPRRCLRRHRHHDLPGLSLRVEVRGRRDHRQPARRRHHPGLLRVLPVGVLAVRAGGGAGGAGLFGQRIGRHLRPDPRNFPRYRKLNTQR